MSTTRIEIAGIAFTKQGYEILQNLKKTGENCGLLVTCQGKGTFMPPEGNMKLSIGEWTREHFLNRNALIYVGAAGIAVRAIAPYIKSKDKDPAVLVIDEQGKYVIPLLSGHLGGANLLAKQVADILGAIPVITTATDREGRFSPDCFAKDHNMAMSSLKAAKNVAAAVLRGDKVKVYTQFPIEGIIPKELTLCEHITDVLSLKDHETGIVISTNNLPKSDRILSDSILSDRILSDRILSDNILRLYPRVIHVGMGCRKGIEVTALHRFLVDSFARKNLAVESIADISSIDLKKNEEGLISLADMLRVPYRTYTPEELMDIKEEGNIDFKTSTFVKSITGVDNVCERAACRAAGTGTQALLIHKQAYEKMTLAAAIEENVKIEVTK